MVWFSVVPRFCLWVLGFLWMCLCLCLDFIFLWVWSKVTLEMTECWWCQWGLSRAPGASSLLGTHSAPLFVPQISSCAHEDRECCYQFFFSILSPMKETNSPKCPQFVHHHSACLLVNGLLSHITEASGGKIRKSNTSSPKFKLSQIRKASLPLLITFILFMNKLVDG